MQKRYEGRPHISKGNINKYQRFLNRAAKEAYANHECKGYLIFFKI